MKKLFICKSILFFVVLIFCFISCKAKGLEFEPIIVHVKETSTGKTVEYQGKDYPVVHRVFTKIEDGFIFTSGKLLFSNLTDFESLKDGEYPSYVDILDLSTTTPGSYHYSLDGKFPDQSTCKKTRNNCEIINPKDFGKNGTYNLTVYFSSSNNLMDSIVSRYEIKTKLSKNYSGVSDADVEIEMVPVEGDYFLMGSNSQDSSQPIHSVFVSSYSIGKYEITQKQYVAIMGGSLVSYYEGFGNDYPVSDVSWYDAVLFCNELSLKKGYSPCYVIDSVHNDLNNISSSLNDDLKWSVSCDFNANGFRLPTEAEWEFAARGGRNSFNYEYAGSNNIKNVALYKDMKPVEKRKVGGKKPNELGLFDMSGNVAELCWDWYGLYHVDSLNNPKGVSSGTERVRRGGSYYESSKFCKVFARDSISSNSRYSSVGFRVVRRDLPLQKIPPANVSKLSISSKPEELLINWTDPVDEDFDHVEITYSPDGEEVICVDKGVETYSIKNLDGCVYYIVTIESVDSDGNKSVKVNCEGTPIDTTPSSNVLSLTVVPGPEKLTLNWVDPIDVDFKEVLISYTTDENYEIRVDKGVESFLLIGLSVGKVYEFSVKSVDEVGNFSKEKVVRGTPQVFPPAPSGFVTVNKGSFLMGSTNVDSDRDEKPIHKVTVSSFYMAKYEVTQGDYRRLMGTNPCSEKYGLGDDFPVYKINWYNMIEFCNQLSYSHGLTPCYKIDKINQDPNNSNSYDYDSMQWTVICDFNANGYRLPTEAEWEFAASGGLANSNFIYSGSNSLDSVGWFYQNSGYPRKCSPVGTKASNYLGLYDMSGNVREMCWDWYGFSYSPEAVINPIGPTQGSSKVNRGGAYNEFPSHCRLSDRDSLIPCYYSFAIGFRLVRRP